MTADTIECEEGALRVDATIIAEGLGIEPRSFKPGCARERSLPGASAASMKTTGATG